MYGSRSLQVRISKAFENSKTLKFQTKHRTKISVNDPRDECNESLLFHAAFRDRRRCVRSLLYKHGAMVDILKAPTMVTPIFATVANNNLEILDMLLDKNATLNVEDKDGSIFPLLLATVMVRNVSLRPERKKKVTLKNIHRDMTTVS